MGWLKELLCRCRHVIRQIAGFCSSRFIFASHNEANCNTVITVCDLKTSAFPGRLCANWFERTKRIVVNSSILLFFFFKEAGGKTTETTLAAESLD